MQGQGHEPGTMRVLMARALAVLVLSSWQARRHTAVEGPALIIKMRGDDASTHSLLGDG